jgi:hypothetical protein
LRRQRHGRGYGRGGLTAAGRQLGKKRRRHRDQVAGAAVAHHGADEISRQAADAGSIEDREQRLGLRLAPDHRACQQAAKVGAFVDHAAQSCEVLGHLVE